MSVLLSHPFGNANVRAALKGLADAHLLSAFYTGIASFEGSLTDGLGALPFLSEIRRRRFDTQLQPYTHSYPLREAGRLIAQRAGLKKMIAHETGFLSVDAVIQYHDRHVARKLSKWRDVINAVYCYEDGAAFTFRESKKNGMIALYDLPIGYWRCASRLMQNERERWPDWCATLTGFRDSESKLQRKDEELQLADAIFVASSFTAKTLEDYPGKLAPVHVIPYGFPPVAGEKDYSGMMSRKKLRFLFVGGLSQRKGIADLFAVANEYKEYIELTIVGQKSTGDCPALDAALQKHQWIPSLPHQGILQLMQQQDVFVFPSLFEGFGLVITEAMSQGMPVITTERTAGADLIKQGQNGWLTQAASTDSLRRSFEHFVQHPKEIVTIGRAAMRSALARPWTIYEKELADTIANII